MQKEDERLLMHRARQGDRDALGTLWDALTPKLYGYLVNALRDKSVADDVLQQTWLKVITHLEQYTPARGRFGAWIFAIAHNECRQYWRARTHVPLDAMTGAEAPQAEAPRDTALMLDAAMRLLSDDDRELLRLRYIADLSFRDLARALNISTIAARVRVHRALARARQHITL